MSDTYKSISSTGEGLYKELGSRFIAFAYPVETESEVKALVAAARKEYHDARHHCYAYRLGLGGTVWRASDDGEPSGSAGRPILGQIDSAGLSDVLVIVVRYFGGIKLGVPGLIRAYKESTADALAHAPVAEKVAGNWYSLSFGYDAMPQAMKLIKDLDLPSRNRVFEVSCSIEVRVRLNQQQDFLERISVLPIFATLLSY
ncbi:MAG: YigZ family protein [Bacteroidales bacterium]|nr:YigZ family protein [Bacteroidales bacterium]MBO4566452.1 YigZ family protein [Bacteroidales bacterium]